MADKTRRSFLWTGPMLAVCTAEGKSEEEIMAHWEENFDRQAKLQQTDVPKDEKEENIYDTHRRSVLHWRQCCEKAAAAQCQLAQAKDEMDRISKSFYDYLQQQMTDPTLSQPPETVPGNGVAMQERISNVTQGRSIPLLNRY